MALAPERAKLVLVARREKRLVTLKDEVESNGGTALILPLDLSRPET